VEEASRGMRQGLWGEYVVNGKTYFEKNDAQMSLSRLFSTKQGIEGSQMLSMLFNPSIIQQGGNDKTIGSAGCFSHEKPMQAIPINLLNGIANPFPIELHPYDMNRIVRVRISHDSDGFIPLNKPISVDDEEHILSMGLITRAQKLAQSNPTNMGAGTQEGKVLTAMLETTVQLPELVGNGATMKHATNILKNNLGVR
jgi:hypothetical protein